MPKLRIGDLEAKIPLIQGGMGVGISLSGLASAVANEGGIGVIAAAGIGMHEPDLRTDFRKATERALRNEIARAKNATQGIIGVNIMVALSDSDDLAAIALDAGADLLFMGAGLPLRNHRALPLDSLRRIAAKTVPIVSSAKAARIIFRLWEENFNMVPNAVVVEGPLAGGHLGFKKEQIGNPDYSLEKLVPEVISVVASYEQRFGKDIPVIAAGGIYTGADIHRFMRLGAMGVQMATRFVATYECDASPEFKEAYINCKKEDLIIIDSPVGLPGRAIKNRFLDQAAAGLKRPFKCPWKCLKTCDVTNSPYCIAVALVSAKKGKLNKGFAFAGANAYRIDKIISVKELIQTLTEEYICEEQRHDLPRVGGSPPEADSRDAAESVAVDANKTPSSHRQLS